MASQVKYPGTISQSTSSSYVQFNNLNNLKNENATYAKTAKVGNKSSSKKTPATLTLTNFQFNIPEGAEITDVAVEYAHQRLDYVQGKYPAFPAPTVKLKSSGVDSVYVTKNGAVPATSLKQHSVHFKGEFTAATGTGSTNYVDGSQTITIHYDLPSREKINSANFGVTFQFGANTSANEGYLQFKYIRIRIYYRESVYTIKVSKLTSEEMEVWNKYPFEISVSNINLTSYQPAVTVSLPSDVSVSDVSGDGIFSTTGTTITWNIPFSTDKGTATLRFNLLFNSSGSKSITATESLNNTSGSLTGLTVNALTVVTAEDIVAEEQIIYARQNTDFKVPIRISDELSLEGLSNIYLLTDTALKIKNGSSYSDLAANTYITIPLSSFVEGLYEVTAKSTTSGEIALSILTQPNAPSVPAFQVRVLPSGLSYPDIVILPLSEEEMNRLGDGKTYTAITNIQLVAGSASYYHDYYRNCRIGVVNNTNSTTPTEIFESCRNWSDSLTAINVWEDHSTEFTYDKNYPVYIIMTGSFLEDTYYDECNFKFTDINLVESDEDYIENYCQFPVPILNILDENNVSSENISVHKEGNVLKLYDLPFEDEFGTGEKYSIRGIELHLTCEVTNPIIANAILRDPHGQIGQESLTLSPGIEEYVFGGKYNLWGFKIGEIEQLNQWEIHLVLSNIFENPDDYVEVNIMNAYCSIYYEILEGSQVSKFYVEGENLEWYGAFIQDYELPAGIQTDTKFLNIDGTDTNSAYRMNIREKEMTIEFDIDGCNLKDSTALLNEITKLFTNKRDELDQPIPKKIEANFLPDDYFEYILEKGIEANVELTGYKCKAKLTIPDGTSFKKNQTITNANGIVTSLAKVSPYIVVIPSDNILTVDEKVTGQKFTATNDSWIGKYVEIDCEDRVLWLRDTEDADPVNITGSVDINSDWFTIDDVYRFNGTNCIINSVAFTERG